MNKNILVVFPSSLVPAIMASQKITIEQILSFAKTHNVTVLNICRTMEEIELSKAFFKDKGIEFHFILSNGKYSFLRKISTLRYLIIHYLFGIRFAYLKSSSRKVIKEIISKIDSKYHIVVSNFWFGSKFFNYLDSNVYKVLYTHALAEELIELTSENFYHTPWHWQERRTNEKNLGFQQRIFDNVDLLVVNSKKTESIVKNRYPNIKSYYCPGGQDLSYYIEYQSEQYDTNTILFYGSLSGIQNIDSFRILYERVWPLILESNPDAQLLIVGNQPPDWIRNLDNVYNITVTGYVDDIRKFIQKACCMILPMSIGVGFRSRVVEVMALGVPVVGNYNALDCIGLNNGVNGFITDNYNEMAEIAVKLMNDNELRKKISIKGRNFIMDNYSIEATFDKLSEYFFNLKI